MNEELILVDLNDIVIGKGEKIWVHLNGKLHRAFSVFIVSGDKMLLQKRSKDKYHSGGMWANACCSHPRYGENLEEAVNRRLMEELGIKTVAREAFYFIYRTSYENGLTEFEYDHVFIGNYFGDIKPSSQEIDDVKWINIKELKKDVADNPQKYASWFIIAFPKVLDFLQARTVNSNEE